MSLGPLGPPPGPPAQAGRCARCGRRIGAHLAYPDPDTPPGGGGADRVCYRCHQERARGHVPPTVADVAPRRRTAEFVMFRLAAFFVALMTLVVTSRTGRLDQFLLGCGGVILLVALSRRHRPARRRAGRGEAVAPQAQSGMPRTKETGTTEEHR